MPVPRKLACALALVLLAGGCDQPDEQPAPARSSPAAVARFSGVDGGCPALSGPVAGRYDAASRGRPADSAAAVPGVTTIDCQWAPAAARPSVSVSVSIFPNGFAPAGDGAGNARHFYDGLRADAGDDAEEPSAHVTVADDRSASGRAFTAAYAPTDSVTYSTLAGNAVVTVVVRDRDSGIDDLDARARALAGRVGPDGKALAGQVVAALR